MKYGKGDRIEDLFGELLELDEKYKMLKAVLISIKLLMISDDFINNDIIEMIDTALRKKNER